MSKTGSQYVMAAFIPRGAGRKLKLTSKNYNTRGHTIFEYIILMTLSNNTSPYRL